MTIEHEKMILTTFVVYPELLQVFWNRGLGENFFKGSNSVLIYRLICDLEKEDKVSWENLEHYCLGKVSLEFTGDLQRKTFISTPRFSKKHLTTLIDEIEEYENDAEIQKIVASRDVLNRADKERIAELSIKKELPQKEVDNTMSGAMREYENWKESEKTGVSTGFPTIDRYMGDLSWGEVFSIWGRTFTGKTFVAINILQSLVLNGSKDVGFFSMEMSKPALVERMVQVYCEKNRNNIEQQHKTETEGRFKDIKIYSQVCSVYDVGEIVKSDNLRVVIIDHLQLVSGKGISLYEKTTNKIQEMKAMAKNLNIIIIVLVQLSRKAGEGAEEVRLDMARDSGAIEENCDFILGIWNPKNAISKGTLPENTRSIRLIKNKRGMTIGTDIHFDLDTGKMLEQ